MRSLNIRSSVQKYDFVGKTDYDAKHDVTTCWCEAVASVVRFTATLVEVLHVDDDRCRFGRPDWLPELIKAFKAGLSCPCVLPRQIRACRVRPIPINQALLSRSRGRVIYYNIFLKQNEASNFSKQAGNHVSSLFVAPDNCNYLKFITRHSFQFFRESF